MSTIDVIMDDNLSIFDVVIDDNFRPPSINELQKYTNCRIDNMKVSLPTNLTLIGYQSNCNKCYKQYFVVKNEKQFQYICSNFTKFAAVIPTANLNNTGRLLYKDYIIKYDEIKYYNKIK
jgi:hypothetical protein